MNSNNLTIVILDCSSEKKQLFQEANQTQRFMNDLEHSKPTLKSAYQVKEDNRSFLCCFTYDTAPFVMYICDIIFGIILALILVFQMGRIDSIAFQLTFIFLIIYEIPRLVTYSLYSKNPQNRGDLSRMFIVRIITATLFIFGNAALAWNFISTYQRNPYGDNGGLNQFLQILGIVFIVIPATIANIIDWRYIAVLKQILDEMA
eukprot:403366743